MLLALTTMMLGDSVPALWVQAVSLYLVPVAIAVGVLRYRLLGIDLVLRRGLV